MIIARITGDPPTLVIGLDRENCKELLKGNPIFKDGEGMPFPMKLIVMGGETAQDIQEELEKHFGPMPMEQISALGVKAETLVNDVTRALAAGVKHVDHKGEELSTVQEVLDAIKRDGGFGFGDDGKPFYTQKGN